MVPCLIYRHEDTSLTKKVDSPEDARGPRVLCASAGSPDTDGHVTHETIQHLLTIYLDCHPHEIIP